MKTLSDLEKAIQSQGLLGVNLYQNDGKWHCWTRKKNSNGWSCSPASDTLEQAVQASLSRAEDDDDWSDLI